MKHFFTLSAAVLFTVTTYAQVGIGTATLDVSTVLDVQSTTKGFLLPRMTETERDNIASPAAGLVVWCTNCSLEGELQFFNGSAWTKSGVLPGTVQGQMRYWNGTDWAVIPSGSEGQVLTYANGVPTWTEFGNSLPDAPTIGTVVAGNAQATVPFTAPSSDGSSAITSYTATSSPGGITGIISQSGSGSITVTGLTNGSAYTFSVTATNAIGTSAASDTSNSVVPTTTIPDAPTIGTVVAGNQQATVPFTAPSSDGGSAITSYTATSSPGGITGTISQSGSGSITVTGITNGTAYTFSVTATNAIGTSAASDASSSIIPVSPVGDFYQGGVIFYLFEAGDTGYVAGETHGLIAAVADQSSGIRWYKGSYSTTGATATAIGAGSANTDTIITVQGATETSYAAGLARAYTGGGYTDWFLPSKDELIKMYLKKGDINTTALANGGSNFANVYYWSSTEAGKYDAWIKFFSNANSQGFGDKSFTYNVRAVRAF